MGKIKGILPEYRSNTGLIESNSPQGALYCLTWNTSNSAVWVTTNTIVCWLWLFHPDKTRRFILQKATWLHKAELGGKLSPSHRDWVPLRWELHELPQWWLFCSLKHHPAFKCLLILGCSTELICSTTVGEFVQYSSKLPQNTGASLVPGHATLHSSSKTQGSKVCGTGCVLESSAA